MIDISVLASWIDAIFDSFSDKTIYFSMAAVGTILFGIRLLLMLVFGLDDGGDFDVDVDADGGGIEAHGGDFSLFSSISILSFMMGAGWLGLTARIEWGVAPVAAAVYAALFGFALMLFSSFMVWQMRKLSSAGGYDVNDCVGKVGRVYLKVPPKGQGRGQVQITVSGSQKILDAVSTGEEIESFAAVRVIEVQETETLVVERA